MSARTNGARQTREDEWATAGNTGLELFRAGRQEDALPYLEQAAAARAAQDDSPGKDVDAPLHGRILSYLGMAQFSTGRNAAAADTFARAIAQTPGKARLHYNLGNALFADDRLPEARRQYEIALSLDPDYEEAERALVVVGAELHSSNLADNRTATPFSWKPLNEAEDKPDSEAAKPEPVLEASGATAARNGGARSSPEQENGRAAFPAPSSLPQNAQGLEAKMEAARAATERARADLDARLAQERELLTALSSLQGVRQAVAACRHALAAREHEEREIVAALLAELVREPDVNAA